MPFFEVIRIAPDGEPHQKRWAVDREEQCGVKTIVSALYLTQYEAEREANRLTVEAARGRLG